MITRIEKAAKELNSMDGAIEDMSVSEIEGIIVEVASELEDIAIDLYTLNGMMEQVEMQLQEIKYEL